MASNNRPSFSRRRPAAALLLALCLAVGACSLFQPPAQTRGNKVDSEQLKELVPGTSTKADVVALIGSPTQRAAFDDNSWLYISEITRSRVARTPGILDQGVVVLTFDDKGVLTNVRSVTQADALPVSVAARTTPSPGTEASFMQQLLGNIGRFSPGGTSFTPGGGAPTPSSGF